MGGKSNAGLHIQVRRFGKPSHGKGSQPPVPGAYVGNLYAFAEKPERKGRHVTVFHALKKSCVVFLFFQYAVRIVDADFCSGMDAVLAFPQFQKPCSAFKIKINRKAVEDYVKPECRFIVQGTVAEVSLPDIKA